VGGLTFFSSASNTFFLSSGVLISPEWLLTAGHVANDPETHTISLGGTTYANGSLQVDNQHLQLPAGKAEQT